MDQERFCARVVYRLPHVPASTQQRPYRQQWSPYSAARGCPRSRSEVLPRAGSCVDGNRLSAPDVNIEPVSAIEIVSETSPENVEAAARIWAEATAARDGDPDVAPLALARAVISSVVERQPGAMLLMAVGAGSQPVGFAALERSATVRAELRYLGVSPSAWGQGIAARLLTELAHILPDHGFDSAELWVYEDNYRAIALYQRLGWRSGDVTRTHQRSGRSERHYLLEFGAPRPRLA